jgi:hypothetical protein
MKRPLISPAFLKPVQDAPLIKILCQCGAYYRCADLFYRELWQQRLANIGLRVISIERLPYHPVWDIRLRGQFKRTNLLIDQQAVSSEAGRV